MSDPHSPAVSDQAMEPQPARAERQEWIFRAITGVIAFSFLWLTWRTRNDGFALVLLVPLMVGIAIATLRLPKASNAVNSIENWLRAGSARAAARQGKLARFFQRPWFVVCLALCRWTAGLPDPHLRAGIRLTSLILLCGVAVILVVSAAYIVVAVIVVLAVLALFLWLLSIWAGSGSSGRKTRITRYTTDWLGRPRQEHFDSSGYKVGETRPSSDWLGRTRMVHTDAEGKVVGESRPETTPTARLASRT